uniref:Uncharacterized protein n=1 Tax=Anguilla anguilla TaxID=7936 RepID=A0A0E9Q667_ANGAN
MSAGCFRKQGLTGDIGQRFQG